MTGANTGIGLETARELARNGADVILTTRSEAKGEAAVKNILDSIGGSGKVRFLVLDLGCLAYVEAFASTFKGLVIPFYLCIFKRVLLQKVVMKTESAMTHGA